MTAGRAMPTQDDVLGYFDSLSNWGRWGGDDELGTLNLTTDDVRLAAARAVRHGRSVSCAWEVAVPRDMERSMTTCPCAADMPGAENMPVAAFHQDRRWGFSSERLAIAYHGNQDVQPSGYDDVLMPVHAVSLVAMGLWMLDNCDLEACAATATALDKWDFQLAFAPVRFAGTSGSPVNPIATF